VIQDYQSRETLPPVERTLEQDTSVISQQEKIVAQHVIGAAINGELVRKSKEKSNAISA
jgi:hypothetical protein